MGRSRSALDVEDRDEGYRRTILLVSFLVCFVLQPSRGTGQTVGAITGAINGTVTDTSGAVLPGVTIVASSDAVIGNKGKRTTVANGNGLYRFPALAPGEYQLVFTLDGFTTLEREGIYVGVGLTVTIDVEMHIATLQQKVTVVRNSPVIDQQSAAIVTTFDSHQLANLPGGRSMWAIQAATPAVYLPRFDLGATATGLGTAISA
jgi:Carboxypeptidase regulatory-like domain